MDGKRALGWCCGFDEVSEVFAVRVVGGGKVTLPLAVRELVGIEDDDYVRLSIVEVIKKKKKTLKERGQEVRTKSESS